MRVTYGVGNTVDRSLQELFGTEDVNAKRVVCHFSGLFGYDPDRVEAYRDGAALEDETPITDDDVINITTKANTKG